jgi:hypothetical protein
MIRAAASTQPLGAQFESRWKMKMSPWTYLIVGGILGAVSTVLITLGLNELKRRDEIYSLSAPPSLEIDLIVKEGGDVVSFHNTGAHNIINMEVYPVAYTLSGSPLKITNRIQPSGNMRVADKLKSNDTIEFPTSRFTLMYEGTDQVTQSLNFIALVVVYRRELDNKRFVAIEPFFLSTENNKRSMGTLYSGGTWSHSGSPEMFLSVVKQIVDTEKILFRVQ